MMDGNSLGLLWKIAKCLADNTGRFFTEKGIFGAMHCTENMEIIVPKIQSVNFVI